MKKIQKRGAALALALLLTVGLLAGCGQTAAPATTGDETDTLHIVTTIFPIYDWVAPALAAYDAPDRTALSLLALLGTGVKEEEHVEGMEEHDHEDAEHEDAPEPDEHVWLSLRAAQTCCTDIAEALGRCDPAHADDYAANAAQYVQQLAALDRDYQEAVAGAARHTLLFADRFPFRYLVDDYGLDYYAAFSGCSAESEASFETVTFLAQKVDELDLPCVLVLEGTRHPIAEAVVAATEDKDQQILTMDSMQTVTAQDAANGVTYLSVMEKDLAALRAALS